MDIRILIELLAGLCLLVSFFIGKNAVWGALTIGILICLVIWIINIIRGVETNWSVLLQVLSYTVLLGALFEVIGRLFKKKK